MTKSILLQRLNHSNLLTPPTTSLARRALLLLTFFIFGLGNVWGEITWATLPTKVDYYQEMPVVPEQTTYEFSLMGQASLIQTALGEQNVRYARWFILDSDGDFVNCLEWKFERLGGYTDGWLHEKGNTFWNLNTQIAGDNAQWSGRESFLMMKITAPEGTDMTGKKVVAVFSSIAPNSNPQYGADATEPELQAMCVFEFLPDDVFSGEAKSTCKNEYNITTNITSKTTITLDKDKISLATAQLPDGATAKYARFYVRYNGEIINLKDNPSLLTISGVEPEARFPIRPIYGYYLYNNGDNLDLSNISVTLNVNEGILPEYDVVCVLSTDDVKDISGDEVVAEPDWDVVFTYRFMEAVTLWTTESNVEWSPQSMQITAPDIVTEKSEYDLGSKKAHYTMRWYVVDDDGVKNLQLGNSRVDDIWSINVSSNPFEVVDNYATVSNRNDIGIDAWNKWAAPQFYAPKNVTFTQLAAKHTRFVCEFYENDDASYPELQSIAYTVYIDRTEPMGQLKDGGLYGEGLVQDITHEMEEHTFPLRNAIIAYHENFNNKPVTYIRIYLTKNDGTGLDPTEGTTELLEVKDATNDAHLFVNNKMYGYYFQNEEGIAISNAKAHVTLPAGMFTYYNVVVAMSGDKGETEHTSGLENISHRAAVISNPYEPDYDYIYTFKFAETSSFPGALIESFIPHSEEVLVTTATEKVTIPLSNFKDVFVSELGKNSFSELVGDYFHVRWFVAKKNPDGSYEKLPNSEDCFPDVELDTEHWSEVNQGIYWNSDLTNDTEEKKILDIDFKKPDGGNWSDYQVVVWMTNDKTGAEIHDKTLSKAPKNIKIQYVFNFFEEENWKFVHYKGASGRDYFTVNAEDPNYRDSRIDAVGSPLTQYDWDNATSTAFATTDDIRQSVHTVEYELYVGDGEVELSLPFQEGDGLEPTAYIRWYDYTTDLNTSMLDPKGSQLRRFEESFADESKLDRGWFHIDTQLNAGNSSSTAIGMKFKGGMLNENETAVIACDVSKYYDGSYQTASDGKFTLLHEPTLSIRYIFTIRRAKVCADAIKEKADIFEEALKGLKNNTVKYSDVKDNMFGLFEDNGRTVVALNGDKGKFSVRTNLAAFNYYHIYDGGSTTEANGAEWYAYYEDEKGLWFKEGALNGLEIDWRSPRVFIAEFEKSLSGTYTLLDQSDQKYISTAKGARLHLIGYLKGGNTKVAAIHYEFCFIDAPAIPVLDLRNADDTKDDYDFYLKRTREYLDANLTPAGAVTFDDKFLKEDGSINYDKPTKWEENIREMPLEWNEAEYSFCYPSIDAYRQYNGWTGFTPQHGDYLLLKSMKLSGVSDDDYKLIDNNMIWERHWYYKEETTLRDYTYTYKHGDNESYSDYGGFFYVDASEEARTIANLKFSASLCRGSEIHFTMAVADATESGKTAPQIIAHVYTAKEGKKDQLVMSFLACSLDANIIKGASKEQAKWYQYYGYGVIPSTIELDGSSKDFIVEVDNNSSNTDGADFCVDEIRFYTKTTKLIVEQGIYDCNAEEEPPTNLYINVEDMQSFMAIENNPEEDGKTIYWRICDRYHNPVPENAEGTLYENDKKNFGKTKMPNEIPDISTLPYNNPNGEWGFFKKNEDGKDVVYFSLAYKRLNLEDGKRYYISVYNLAEITEPDDDDDLWGIYTNACDVYSEFFLPRKMYITVTNGEGEDNSEVTLGCGVSSAMVDINVVLHVPDNTQASGFKSYTFEFDFFLGTLADIKQNYEGLIEALTEFREEEGDTHVAYPNYGDLPNECKEGGKYSVIGKAVEDGKLRMLCSAEVGELEVTTDNKTITAIPTQWYVTVTDKNGYPRENEDGSEMRVEICDPFEFTFEILQGDGDGPSLTLGFKEVTTYPNALRVVRVGKKQLRDMQNDYILHVPVHSFTTGKTDETETDGDALIIEGALELLSYKNGDNQTNDQSVSSNSKVVATFVGNEINRTNRQYIALKFHGTYEDDNGTTQNVDKYDFKEGFTYRMFFVIKDKNATAGSCDGKAEFLLKVVPEFVTWNGSGNQWNNDTNWGRSTRAELHKGKAETGPTDDNHETDGHPKGYKDNTDLGINGDNAFVPMKFTYVTIPSNNVAPMLKELTINSEGIYDATSMGSDVTKDIRYDLMVRYTEEKCVTEGHEEYNTDKIYDCEKFYGNWAKEIYFKPNAELVHQHYLTYEKVWVEKLLTANTWTLMSTPLQNTYAGDMYVPYSTDATKNGRQETEAFQDITFNLTDYSRTKYPIYQRSWLQEGSKVYTKTNDVRNDWYSANLVGKVDETFTLWSHTYNDVMVDYSTWKGFAIRAHKKAQKDNQGDDVLALLRLPKKDTNFSYYDWNGNPQPTNQNDNPNRGKYGKLFTDLEDATYVNDNNDVTYGVVYDYGTGTNSLQGRTAGNGNVTESVSLIQSAQGYQLVGNPYLCSINMEKFLSDNEGKLQESGYWTYDGNSASAYTKGQIRPMQSFFVKAKSDAELVFNEGMMIDGNTNPIESQAPALTLTASNGRGQSSATLSVGEEARSVETLFDSNLEDVPMVYTVADGQAVSINQLTELSQPVAFGVTCTASNEPVEVTFTDIDQLTGGDIYVVDAVTGSQTAIGEGDSYTVQPNDYGRYFLLAGTTAIDDKTDVAKGIMVSVRGREVTVTSGEELTQVHALTLNGTTYYETTAIGTTTTSFTLSSGVYIIKAENVAGEQQTVKVVIR